MSDLPTWARVLLYAAGAIAIAVALYAIIYLAVRAALRAYFAEQRTAARRQEDLLRTISTAAEYVADVADAWAEGEAARRAGSPVDAVGTPTPREPDVVDADVASSAPAEHDHAGSGESSS